MLLISGFPLTYSNRFVNVVKDKYLSCHISRTQCSSEVLSCYIYNIEKHENIEAAIFIVYC